MILTFVPPTKMQRPLNYAILLLILMLSMLAGNSYGQPIVNVGPSIDALEGTTVTIDIYLSEVATSPVTLEFVLSADDASRADDFSFVNNPLIIDGSDRGQLSLFIIDDEELEFTEFIELISTTPTGAILGADDSSRVRILEGNVAPRLTVDIEQDTILSNVVTSVDGIITLTAVVDDLNSADTHSFTWQPAVTQTIQAVASDSTDTEATTELVTVNLFSDSDSSSTDTQFVFDPSDASPVALPTNQYNSIIVTATDSSGSSTARLVSFYVTTDTLAVRTDDDADGIINDLDDDDSATNPLGSIAVQAETGISLKAGFFAIAASNGFPSDIILNSEQASVARIPEDLNYTQDADIINVSASGHYQGAPYALVLPLTDSLTARSVLRLFDRGIGRWRNFFDDNNLISGDLTSSSLLNGKCPAPNADSYTLSEGSNANTDTSLVQLIEGDQCIRLSVFEGGRNDADIAIDGSVELIARIAEFRASTLTVQFDTPVVTGNTSVVTVGDTVLLTVTVLDAESNPVSGIDVTLGLTQAIFARTPTTTFDLTDNSGQTTLELLAVTPGVTAIIVTVGGVITYTDALQVVEAVTESSGSGRFSFIVSLLFLSLLLVNNSQLYYAWKLSWQGDRCSA